MKKQKDVDIMKVIGTIFTIVGIIFLIIPIIFIISYNSHPIIGTINGVTKELEHKDIMLFVFVFGLIGSIQLIIGTILLGFFNRNSKKER